MYLRKPLVFQMYISMNNKMRQKNYSKIEKILVKVSISNRLESEEINSKTDIKKKYP